MEDVTDPGDVEMTDVEMTDVEMTDVDDCQANQQQDRGIFYYYCYCCAYFFFGCHNACFLFQFVPAVFILMLLQNCIWLPKKKCFNFFWLGKKRYRVEASNNDFPKNAKKSKIPGNLCVFFLLNVWSFFVVCIVGCGIDKHARWMMYCYVDGMVLWMLFCCVMYCLVD